MDRRMPRPRKWNTKINTGLKLFNSAIPDLIGEKGADKGVGDILWETHELLTEGYQKMPIGRSGAATLGFVAELDRLCGSWKPGVGILDHEEVKRRVKKLRSSIPLVRKPVMQRVSLRRVGYTPP